MSIRSERIKSLIEQSKLTYQELEKVTGIKKSSLQRYASGVTTKIPLDVIEKLSKAFDVSQEYLMGWDEKAKEISPNEPKLTE
jgi:transcriptional regulator with XRE-family HTH domain